MCGKLPNMPRHFHGRHARDIQSAVAGKQTSFTTRTKRYTTWESMSPYGRLCALNRATDYSQHFTIDQAAAMTRDEANAAVRKYQTNKRLFPR